jgi:hypothetical protein
LMFHYKYFKHSKCKLFLLEHTKKFFKKRIRHWIKDMHS